MDIWPDWQCPVHQLPLQREMQALQCSSGCTYEVRGNVPRFVSGSQYTDAFGVQWNRYRRTQLDSYTGVPVTASRVRRNLGEELWNSLSGRTVLEAGCGAGRFTEVLLNQGALVTSVDLSDAVDANAATFPPSDRHRVAQADLFALPFAPRQFDLVFCLGVIQHTPDPDQAITCLYEQVNPGGWLLIDQYAARNISWFTKTAPLFRHVLRRLPPDKGLRATERLVSTFFPLHTAARNHPHMQKILSRLSPVSAYYHAYPDLDAAVQREWSLLDTHDSLTDWHRHLRTHRSMRSLLASLGVEIERCERHAYSIEVRGRRPVSAA